MTHRTPCPPAVHCFFPLPFFPILLFLYHCPPLSSCKSDPGLGTLGDPVLQHPPHWPMQIFLLIHAFMHPFSLFFHLNTSFHTSRQQVHLIGHSGSAAQAQGPAPAPWLRPRHPCSGPLPGWLGTVRLRSTDGDELHSLS